MRKIIGDFKYLGMWIPICALAGAMLQCAWCTAGCTLEIKPNVQVDLCVEQINGKIETVDCDAGAVIP